MLETSSSSPGLSSLSNHLFDAPVQGSHSLGRKFILLALFLIGAIHWAWFFHWGELALTVYDWRKECGYLTILQQAIRQCVIPLQVSTPAFQGTRNFMGIPEVTLTPDIVVLPWLDPAGFAMAHTIIMYSLGFFGSLMLARRLNASIIAFTLFFLLFNFNGFITSHLAIGHFQWTGYFLLPFCFMLLLRFTRHRENRISLATLDMPGALAMGLLLGFMLLNGSFHIAAWCSMFMLFMVIVRRGMLLNFLVAMASAACLSAGRLLPAAMSFWEKDNSFVTGYPKLAVYLEALASMRTHQAGPVAYLGWWEYDMYIGFAALAAMVTVTVILIWKGHREIDRSFLYAALAMLILSFDGVYSCLAHLPIAGIERVSSRFAIMAFMTWLIMLMYGVDYVARIYPKICRPIMLLALPLVAIELMRHSMAWLIILLESNLGVKSRLMPYIIPNTDAAYATVVYGSWIFALISLIVVSGLIANNYYNGQRK